MDDIMKQPERDNRIKKYGGWANNISDAEAEKIVHDYGDVAYLFKRIFQKAFGEKYTPTRKKQQKRIVKYYLIH